MRLAELQEGHRIEVVDVDDVKPGQAHLEGMHVVFEVDDFQASFLQLVELGGEEFLEAHDRDAAALVEEGLDLGQKVGVVAGQDDVAGAELRDRVHGALEADVDDHNRAIAQLAHKTGAANADIKDVVVWGNHSADQYPDVSFAKVAGKPATELVDEEWLSSYYRPTVAKRGAAIIEARGASSAASAANAAIDHMHSWIYGTAEGEWVTAGVMSDGTHYGVPAGLNFGFPVTSDGGEWQVVDGLEISDATRAGIDHNIKALQEEYGNVKALGFIK